METNNILTLFENSTPVRRFSKGDIIYYQGDNADSFYYLKKGKVRVYMTSADGMEKTLSTATSGEIMGEAAFFDKRPRISSGKALTNCEIAVISSQTLMTLIKENPQIAMELLKIQAIRIRQLSTQLDSMTFLQADGRIARLLLQNVSEGRGELTVSLTHEEIGNMIGVSRVTVSKILNDFAKKAYLKTSYRKITILNLQALQALCEFE